VCVCVCVCVLRARACVLYFSFLSLVGVSGDEGSMAESPEISDMEQTDSEDERTCRREDHLARELKMVREQLAENKAWRAKMEQEVEVTSLAISISLFPPRRFTTSRTRVAASCRRRQTST
jgi:hypothetical protein